MGRKGGCVVNSSPIGDERFHSADAMCSKNERIERGMTPFLDWYTCKSVMITIELRYITYDFSV